jgi:hypothetical protein
VTVTNIARSPEGDFHSQEAYRANGLLRTSWELPYIKEYCTISLERTHLTGNFLFGDVTSRMEQRDI